MHCFNEKMEQKQKMQLEQPQKELKQIMELQTEGEAAQSQSLKIVQCPNKSQQPIQAQLNEQSQLDIEEKQIQKLQLNIEKHKSLEIEKQQQSINLSSVKQQDQNLTKTHDKKSTSNPIIDSNGFDAVVQTNREKRKLAFGPNCVQLKKPNNILVDIYGVIVPWTFTNYLNAFAKENIDSYLNEYFETKFVKIILARLNEQAIIEQKAGNMVPEILPNPDNSTNLSKEKILESIKKSIKWLLDHRPKTMLVLIDKLCTDLWAHALDNGKLTVEIYPDVVDAFNYWRFEEFIKIYSYASGPTESQRKFLRSTTYGDINQFIANCINSKGGYKFDCSKFKCLCSALRETKPENLLYITDSPKKAISAKGAGLSTVVVNRTGTATGKYDPKLTANLTVVTTLSDIEFIFDPNQLNYDCC